MKRFMNQLQATVYSKSTSVSHQSSVKNTHKHQCRAVTNNEIIVTRYFFVYSGK